MQFYLVEFFALFPRLLGRVLFSVTRVRRVCWLKNWRTLRLRQSNVIFIYLFIFTVYESECIEVSYCNRHVIAFLWLTRQIRVVLLVKKNQNRALSVNFERLSNTSSILQIKWISAITVYSQIGSRFLLFLPVYDLYI